ncbi:MAG: hypothetical protein LC799_34250, partial [Actinobacteria bacterium]|nr:hypothetical protein [Actinomycetota bacterium]
QATPPASGPTDPGQDSNIASVDGGSHPSERRRPHPHLTVDGMPHERQPKISAGPEAPEKAPPGAAPVRTLGDTDQHDDQSALAAGRAGLAGGPTAPSPWGLSLGLSSAPFKLPPLSPLPS